MLLAECYSSAVHQAYVWPLCVGVVRWRILDRSEGEKGHAGSLGGRDLYRQYYGWGLAHSGLCMQLHVGHADEYEAHTACSHAATSGCVCELRLCPMCVCVCPCRTLGLLHKSLDGTLCPAQQTQQQHQAATTPSGRHVSSRWQQQQQLMSPCPLTQQSSCCWALQQLPPCMLTSRQHGLPVHGKAVPWGNGTEGRKGGSWSCYGSSVGGRSYVLAVALIPIAPAVGVG